MNQMKRFGAIALVLLVTVGLVAAGAGGVFALGNNSTNGTDNGTGMNMSDNGTGMNMSDNGTGMNMSDNESDNATGAPAEGMNDSVATVEFDNQTSDGTTVTVNSAYLPEDGYIAIHNATLLGADGTPFTSDDQPLTSVIGVSEYLESGDHDDVQVHLFNVPGESFPDQQLNGNQTLIAMPHEETNGNQAYNFISSNGSADGPYTNNSHAVVDTGYVTVQANMNNGGGSGKAKAGSNMTTTTTTNGSAGGSGKAKAGSNMTTTTSNNTGGSGKAKAGSTPTTTNNETGGSGKAKTGDNNGGNTASGGNGKAKAGASGGNTTTSNNGGNSDTSNGGSGKAKSGGNGKAKQNA